MPNIDVTPGIALAANTLNSYAGGYAQGTVQRETLEQRQEALEEHKRAATEAARQRQQLIDERIAEAARQREAEGGQLAALEFIAKERQDKFKFQEPVTTGTRSFFGESDIEESTFGKEELAQFDQYERTHRENLEQYGSTMSEAGRRAYYAEVMDPFDADMADERSDIATRQAGRLWKEAATSGLFDEEEMASAQEAMQGLATGQVDPTAALKSLRMTKAHAAARTERKINFTKGSEWWQAQIAEAPIDKAKGLAKAYTQWLQTDDLDPEQLQRMSIMAQYGVDPKAKKIGTVDVTPERVPFGSSQWNRIADHESRKESHKLAAADPRVKVASALLGKADNKNRAELQAQLDKTYKTVFDENVDMAKASYAASFGATDEQIEALMSPKRAKLLRDERIREIEDEASRTETSDKLDAPYEDYLRSKDPKSIEPQAKQPKLSEWEKAEQREGKAPKPTNTQKAPTPGVEGDLNNDGVLDEKDIDAAYGGGGN